MRNYFIIFIFIFLLIVHLMKGCKELLVTISIQNEINSSEEYSFEEYVNLLLNKNKSKEYPDINNFPD